MTHPLGELVTTTPYTPEQRISRWQAVYGFAANADILEAQAERFKEYAEAAGNYEAEAIATATTEPEYEH